MTPEQLARLNENLIQGFELVDYSEVALPLWQMNIEAVSVLRKALQPIKEFVLRALDAGVSPDDLPGFLGLDEAVVQGAIVDLASERLVALTESITVTEGGKKALAEGISTPAIEILPILFDGIIRRPIGNEGLEFAFGREVEDGVLVEIPAIPSGQPAIEDLNLADIDLVLQEHSGGRSEVKKDILRLKRVMKFKRLFRRGVGLVFKSRSGDLRTIFVVNGARDEKLEYSFAEAGGNVRKGLVRAFSESYLQANLRKHLGSEASQKVLQPLDYASQQRAVSFAKLRLALLKRRATMASQGEIPQSEAPNEGDFRAAEEALEDCEAALGSAAARPASVYECTEVLERALLSATKSVSISTRGFAPHIVDVQLLRHVSEAISRGVVVTISFRDVAENWRDRGKTWQLAYDGVSKLSKANPDRLILRQTKEDRYFHVAWDHSVALVANRPFLSNYGRNRTFEQFAGFILQDQKLIEAYLHRVHKG